MSNTKALAFYHKLACTQSKIFGKENTAEKKLDIPVDNYPPGYRRPARHLWKILSVLYQSRSSHPETASSKTSCDWTPMGYRRVTGCNASIETTASDNQRNSRASTLGSCWTPDQQPPGRFCHLLASRSRRVSRCYWIG